LALIHSAARSSGVAADFADHNDGVRVRIFAEEPDGVEERRADEGIAADADAGGLAMRAASIDGRLRSQRAAAADDADISLLVNAAGHDADLAFAGRNDAGAVRADEARFPESRQKRAHHVDGGEPSVMQTISGSSRRRLRDGIGGVRWGNENHGGVCAGGFSGVGNGVEDGTLEMLGATFAWVTPPTTWCRYQSLLVRWKVAPSISSVRLQHRCRAAKATGANASVIFRSPTLRRRCHPRSRRRRAPAVVCITEGIPAIDMVRSASVVDFRKTRLIGPTAPHHFSRQMQDRHHARPHSQAGKCRRRQPQRHADLRAVHQLTQLGIGQSTCIDRRRSPHRHDVPRRHPVLQRRSGHARHHYDRRNRRQREERPRNGSRPT